jgi:hypothetical protein
MTMLPVPHPPAYLLRRKFLLALPVIALPFLAFIFYSLGGGQGPKKGPAAAGFLSGFNMELPKAKFTKRDSALNKLGYYEKADADSLRRKEIGQRDPYMPHPMTSRRELPHTASEPLPIRGDAASPDQKADALLQQLDRIRKTMRQPAVVSPVMSGSMSSESMSNGSISRVPQRVGFVRPVDTPVADPEIERLNSMLDKVLRIQHPGEPVEGSHPGVTPAAVVGSGTGELLAVDSSNALPAVVPDDQTLTTGTTIALRLSEDGMLNGIRIPRGQLIYGVVNISADRMQVAIHSIRMDHNIYTVALQVYDLDGLPGIHIPGMLSRDVAKQSADQGVSGLNLFSVDPGLGAQAANAGIQTAKSLFSRKVRLVRVGVRAGYQVLLHNTRSISRFPALCVDSPDASLQPPGIVPGGSFLRRDREEGMELGCRGIFLDSGVLWFSLSLRNRSPIEFVPEYARWFVRDRKRFKRTAVQDLALTPVFVPALPVVAGDSSCGSWTGFKPFALGKDKELVLEVGEKGGGRVLRIVMGHRDLLSAKRN